MAVGLSFAIAAQEGGAMAGAVALALGMGLQNFPEGAAVSLPLRGHGVSRHRAFLYGAASGVVEPIFGLLTVLVAGHITPMMPWVLAFAAGAMIYVVVEELIPEAHPGGALPHRHRQRHGGLPGDDAAGRAAGITRPTDTDETKL